MLPLAPNDGLVFTDAMEQQGNSSYWFIPLNASIIIINIQSDQHCRYTRNTRPTVWVL